MSERVQEFYVTSVSSATVVLSPVNNQPPGQGGLGLQQVTLVTTESTADATFYGTTGTCSIFRVYVRKLQ